MGWWDNANVRRGSPSAQDLWDSSLRCIGASKAAVEVIAHCYSSVWTELFPTESWLQPTVIEGPLALLHAAATDCTHLQDAMYDSFFAIIRPSLAWLRDEVGKWADPATWRSLEQRALTSDSLRIKVQEVVHCSWSQPAQRVLEGWSDAWLGRASASTAGHPLPHHAAVAVLGEPCGTLFALSLAARRALAAAVDPSGSNGPPDMEPRDCFLRAAGDMEARWRLEPPLLPPTPTCSRQLAYCAAIGVIHRTGRRSSRIGLLFDGGLLVLCQQGRPTESWRIARVIRVVASGVTPLSAMAVRADSGSGFGFCVRGKEKSLLCFTATSAAREQWLAALSAAFDPISQSPEHTHPHDVLEEEDAQTPGDVFAAAMREASTQSRAEPGGPAVAQSAPILIPATIAWRCMVSKKPFEWADYHVHCRRCGRCVAPAFAPSRMPLQVPWARKRLMRVCLECTRTHGVHLLGHMLQPSLARSAMSYSATPSSQPPLSPGEERSGSVREHDRRPRRKLLSRTQSGPAASSRPQGSGGVDSASQSRQFSFHPPFASDGASVSSDDSLGGVVSDDEDRVRAWYPSFDTEFVSETATDSVLGRSPRPTTDRSEEGEGEDSEEATTPRVLPPALPAARIERTAEGGGFEDSEFVGSYEDEEDDSRGMDGASMQPLRDSSVTADECASERSSRFPSSVSQPGIERWAVDRPRSPCASLRGGGASARVLHDFAAMAEGTVAVRRGDCIAVLGRAEDDPDWVRVRTDSGTEGEIPEACILTT